MLVLFWYCSDLVSILCWSWFDFVLILFWCLFSSYSTQQLKFWAFHWTSMTFLQWVFNHGKLFSHSFFEFLCLHQCKFYRSFFYLSVTIELYCYLQLHRSSIHLVFGKRNNNLSVQHLVFVFLVLRQHLSHYIHTSQCLCGWCKQHNDLIWSSKTFQHAKQTLKADTHSSLFWGKVEHQYWYLTSTEIGFVCFLLSRIVWVK